jgi:hypothetical protein
MTIEEIKEDIDRRPSFYIGETADALLVAINYLQDAAKHYNVQEGQRAIACLKAIENKFQ